MNDNLTKSSLPRVQPLKRMGTAELAVVSKLHRGREATSTRSSRQLPDLQYVARTVNRTANNNNDAKNLFQVLPDMELAKSIFISSVISPNDLEATKVLYNLLPNDFDDRLTGPMLAVIEDKFDNFYKINKDIYTYLEDALFMKGSHPIMILPENSIDALINSEGRMSLESLSDEFGPDGLCKSYGVLGIPNNNGVYTKPTFESMFVDRSNGGVGPTVTLESMTVIKELKGKQNNKSQAVGGVYVTDNLSLMRRPAIEEKLRQTAQADVYGGVLARTRRHKPEAIHIPIVANESAAKVGPEDVKDLSLDRVERIFYKNRKPTNQPMQTVLTKKQLKRATVGHPLWMNLPSEAVIPIHIPGNPRKHIGYFVVNDMFGNPLSLDSVSDYYNEIRSTLQNDTGMATTLLGSARRMQDGYGIIETTEIEAMQRTYQSTVETDLLNRLRSGILTGDFELSNVQEVYAMMMARSLASKQTMLLYVPASMMVYIAFDYNEYGVGKSMIEGGKTLGSMRAVMMVANTLGATANMINGKNVNFTIPEEDEDPASSVAIMMGEYAKLNRGSAAIGETNPNEIVNRLQEAAVTFTVQGNTRYPEARTEVVSSEGTNKVVDKDWDDELRKRHYQMFGLTPEMVDGVNAADFATTVLNQSVMLTKRVKAVQDDFNPFLTQLVQLCSYSSGDVISELRRVVRESGVALPEEYANDIDAFVDDVIGLVNVALPSPETSTLKSKMESFQEYSDAIDLAMKTQIDPDTIKLYSSENVSPEHITQAANAIGSMLKRRYLREKNILPELDIFSAINELDDPEYNWMDSLTDEYGDRIRIVEKFVQKIIKKEVENSAIIKDNQQKIDSLSGGGDVSFDSSPADDDLSTGDDLTGGGGDDEFNFDDDQPPADDETPPEDGETPPENEEEEEAEPDLDLDIPEAT